MNLHYPVILLIGLSTVKSACELFRPIQEVLLMGIEVRTAGPGAFILLYVKRYYDYLQIV